jgi:hypothetical protein
MRALASGVLAVFVLSLAACAGPYSGPSEKLVMPKKKPIKKATAGPVLDETCKVDFKDKPRSIPGRDLRRKADGLAQDADNLLAGIETADEAQKKLKAMDAIAKATDALRADPYSPLATYVMARAYGFVGKKKCATEMLTRVKEVGAIAEELDESLKNKAKVKKDPAFEAFRKDAEDAVKD